MLSEGLVCAGPVLMRGARYGLLGGNQNYYMDRSDDPFGSYGLSSIGIEDKPIFDAYFSTCHTRLSDYTFANTFIWRDPIHLRWRLIRDCLCVFANGDGGLTMLFPPVGPGDAVQAVQESLAICDEYNARAGLVRWTPRGVRQPGDPRAARPAISWPSR